MIVRKTDQNNSKIQRVIGVGVGVRRHSVSVPTISIPGFISMSPSPVFDRSRSRNECSLCKETLAAAAAAALSLAAAATFHV